MLLSLLTSSNPKDSIAILLLSLPVILIALVFHEVAHGFVAWKCGDSTAYNLGRLTLNPKNHLDPIGFFCMLIFGFGWAKPVPINTRNFRNPKRGMALSALAGPVANLCLGVISALLYGFFWALGSYLLNTIGPNAFWFKFVDWTVLLFMLGAFYNFFFMIFNLIPVPPFDGSRIALTFLPTNIYFRIMRYERQIMFGILIALLVLSNLGFSPFGWVAEKLTELIADPINELFWDNVFLPRLLKK